MQQHRQTIERVVFSGTREQVLAMSLTLRSTGYKVASAICIASDGKGNELYQVTAERLVAKTSPEEWLQRSR